MAASHRTNSPESLRLLGKSIGLLALTALMAYGCEKAKTEQPPPPSPAPSSAKPAEPKPAPSRAAAQPNTTDTPKSAPVEPTKSPTADATKLAPGPDGDKPADKPKPIPHTDIAKDAKPIREFTTPTGVIVQEFKEGDAGAMPTLPKAVVQTHFILRLKDGWKTIQSTYEDGAPDDPHSLDQLVYGMADGIIGMKPGGVRRIIVPPARAFGNEGAKDKDGKVVIPPGATLVYDVELISNKQKIVDKPPTPAAPHTPIRSSEPAPGDVNK